MANLNSILIVGCGNMAGAMLRGWLAGGFSPERFLDPSFEEVPKYAYLPFGGGPRICIGNGFAMMEAKLLLAHIAREYRLDLMPGHPVVPEPVVTLRPKLGLSVIAKRRIGSTGR